MGRIKKETGLVIEEAKKAKRGFHKIIGSMKGRY